MPPLPLPHDILTNKHCPASKLIAQYLMPHDRFYCHIALNIRNGSPFYPDEVRNFIRNRRHPWQSKNICESAAKNGQLELLQWAKELDCGWSECITLAAISGGHLQIVKWLKSEKLAKLDEKCCEAAAKRGDILLLQWLHNENCRMDETTCHRAAENGHLHILKWIRFVKQSSSLWSEKVCIATASKGHQNILEWLHKQDVPWDARACAAAAQNGHLDVLKYLHKNGCPWNEDTTTAAAESGNLEILKWARSQNPPCPWHSAEYLEAINCNSYVLKWLRNTQECPSNHWGEAIVLFVGISVSTTMAKKKGKKGKGKKKEEVAPDPPAEPEGDDFGGGDEFALKKVVFEKPPNQLELSTKELNTVYHLNLNTTDPNVPKCPKVKFQFSSQKYALVPEGEHDHVAVHFSMDGSMLFQESKEGTKLYEQLQLKKEKQEAAEAEKLAIKQRAEMADDGGLPEIKTEENVKNQFDFAERACQTFNNPLREIGITTVPPTTDSYGGSVTQWEIYDSFMNAFLQKKRDEDAMNQTGKKKRKSVKDEDTKKQGSDNIMHSDEMGHSLKIVERMVNQNREDEIYQDFKYWEDLSDQYRDGEGSLLPLWRFSSDRTKHKHVTCLTWHPQFPDLFAAGFGSYNFMQQGTGLVYCYSLKNTSFPEFTFTTETGVMCCDFHPQHHSLLCVGCYDGTVIVFDVRNKTNKPIYKSTVRTGKHTDPVWQVFWQEEDLSKELNFFSVSSDGKVANWLMANTELKMETVMELKLVASDTKDQPDDETSLTGLAGGCCFDFNKRSEHLFVVGTEEGMIHKCSKAYSGQYLETCSADWTVKIWDHNVKTPLITFDLGEAVGDVAWSPYSSTVFAAVTSDGKVHVFDLAVNKHEPLCEQKVVKRSKLTRVQFNEHDPIIVVGDERGSVISMKLSPNLRTSWTSASELVDQESKKAKIDVETENMERLLQSVDAKVETGN
eukprot:g2800.t1